MPEPSIQWVFDPIPPSGARQGGVPAGHVFRPDLDIFVREVLQNSHDQRLRESSRSALVRFRLERITGEERQRFLAGLKWDELSLHVEAVAQGRSPMALRMQQALNRLYSEPLTLLRVDDCDTCGLTGEEDATGTNFSALCRNTLDTSEDRPQRGGSFGLGKAVLWRFSAFSTVLFASRLLQNGELRFRFFGRTELPYHETGQLWSGPGWLGTPQELAQGKRAVSVWDEEAVNLAREVALFRPIQQSTGTSILVVGFQEPAEEQERPLPELARAICDSAVRWFWPALCAQPPTLRVLVEASEGGREVFSSMADRNEEVRPFVRAAQAVEFAERARSEGEVARAGIPFKIPARKPRPSATGEPEIAAELEFRVVRGESGQEHPRRNLVALLRGAGMVVQYRSGIRSPLDPRPFWGVLQAGLARGVSAADQSLERFLRAAEPPAHDEWTTTERVQAEYRPGARARLTELWRHVGEQVMELCEEQAPTTSDGPAELSRFFRLGGRAGGTVTGSRGFLVTHLKAHLARDAWVFEGQVQNLDPELKPWSFQVALCLEGETGRGVRLALQSVQVATQAVELRGDLAEIQVSAEQRTVLFQGRSSRVESGREQELMRRTSVRIEVLPQNGSTG